MGCILGIVDLIIMGLFFVNFGFWGGLLAIMLFNLALFGVCALFSVLFD